MRMCVERVCTKGVRGVQSIVKWVVCSGWMCTRGGWCRHAVHPLHKPSHHVCTLPHTPLRNTLTHTPCTHTTCKHTTPLYTLPLFTPHTPLVHTTPCKHSLTLPYTPSLYKLPHIPLVDTLPHTYPHPLYTYPLFRPPFVRTIPHTHMLSVHSIFFLLTISLNLSCQINTYM